MTQWNRLWMHWTMRWLAEMQPGRRKGIRRLLNPDRASKVRGIVEARLDCSPFEDKEEIKNPVLVKPSYR